MGGNLGTPHQMHSRNEYQCREMQRLCVNRHGGAQYCLLADWSVEKVSLKQLWRLKWHRGYDSHAAPPVWPKWMEGFKEEF